MYGGINIVKKVFVFFCTFFILYFSYIIFAQSNGSILTATYSIGSNGDQVKEIQSRLQKWGYYNGSVDGIYGYKTSVAVKDFQSKNGLSVDGIVGSSTLEALGIMDTNSSSKSYLGSRNETLLSQLITGEARGEPYIGQVAVGGVVLNRINDPRFPPTIPGVIYQQGAFTAVDDGQINLSPTDSSIKAARDSLNGWDPSGGAVYYFNPATATSKWIWSRTQIKTIGKHIFCK